MKSTLYVIKERMMLEQYIKNAKKREQFLYASLLEDKLNGYIQSLYELSEEKLSHLYLQEGVFDSQIANLFDTDRSEIYQLRTHWNIQKKETADKVAI